MIKKIVFFIAWPLNKRDLARYGAGLLLKNGFEVGFYDFSLLLYPSIGKAAIPDVIDAGKYPQFRDRPEALSAISALDEKCFVVLLMPFGKNTCWIYKALSAVKADYAIVVVNAIPNYLSDADNKYARLFKRVSHLTLPKLLRYISGYRFRTTFSRYFGVKEPRFWLAAGEKSTESYFSAFPFGPRTEIMWLHALDYDIYLETKLRGEAAPDKAVFLDMGIPKFLGDEVVNGAEKSALDDKKYYPALCTFFDKVERELNVKVEIAAHPRSEHGPAPDYFGRRPVTRGKTCEMVSRARFVMTHASTAIDFAVLFKKPIVFLTTRDIDAWAELAPGIKSMSAQFGKSPVNIDDSGAGVDWKRELAVDDARYEKYRSDFIKKAGTEELNSWQIFADRLLRMTDGGKK